MKADLILVTHGHFDHVGDANEIAKRTKAHLVATFDLGAWRGDGWRLASAQTAPPDTGAPPSTRLARTRANLAVSAFEINGPTVG